jgi:nitroreductase
MSNEHRGDRAAEPGVWRRRALLGGGALVACASAIGAWRAISTGMVLQGDEAFQAWETWATMPPGEPLSLVAAAVLASSPHNTQPWAFRVARDSIEVLADASRTLGAMDPFEREKWHGLGAAIANIEEAAPARGFVAETVLRPPGSEAHVAARIRLRPATATLTPLAAAIDQRSTNRAAYAPERPVSEALRARLSAMDDSDVRLVWLPADSPAGQRFAQATIAATQQISADKEMSDAGHHWFRANPKETARHRDGVSTPTAGIPTLVATLSPLVPPVDSQTAGEYWLRSTRMHLASAPLYGLIVVRELYDRRTQLLAGARWQRTHLTITSEGLAGHPLNQLVEIVDRDRQLDRRSPTAALLADLSGDALWKPTFAFRVGYATRIVPRSARRSLAAVITTARPG